MTNQYWFLASIELPPCGSCNGINHISILVNGKEFGGNRWKTHFSVLSKASYEVYQIVDGLIQFRTFLPFAWYEIRRIVDRCVSDKTVADYDPLGCAKRTKMKKIAYCSRKKDCLE